MNRVVVSHVRGEKSPLCVEFQRGCLRPTSNAVNFSYIPTDAEIVSMDIVTKEPSSVVVGITLIKRSTKEAFFNLYGIHSNHLSSVFKWENIIDDWQTMNLSFTPFQLLHTQILVDNHWEAVFLLSGDDLCVHMFRETADDNVCYKEASAAEWFPELQGLPSAATHIDVQVEEALQHRRTAVGCQSGFLKCTLVSLPTEIISDWSSKMLDGPITSVKFFTSASNPAAAQSRKVADAVHLLVTSAVEPAIVFIDVFKNGFTCYTTLPNSHLYDCVLCATIADVNWDGRNELVLGTYGKELLVYQLDATVTGTMGIRLLWQRSFAHPIHCLWYGDLTGDGLSEMVVVTMGGIHVLQHDLEKAAALCVSRLEAHFSKESVDTV
eukprot:Em0019g655a